MKVSERSSMVEHYFPTEASRRSASAQLIREAKTILSDYDPQLVAEVRRRREAGESFRQISEALGRHPDRAGDRHAAHRDPAGPPDQEGRLISQSSNG